MGEGEAKCGWKEEDWKKGRMHAMGIPLLFILCSLVNANFLLANTAIVVQLFLRDFNLVGVNRFVLRSDQESVVTALLADANAMKS